MGAAVSELTWESVCRIMRKRFPGKEYHDAMYDTEVLKMATKSPAKPSTIPTAASMRLRAKEGRKNCVLEAVCMSADGGNLTVQLFDQQAPLDAALTETLTKAGYLVKSEAGYQDPDGNSKYVVTISWA
jgi:hypothetical protein